MTQQLKNKTKVPHDRYHDTKKSTYNSQQEVADAWADGAFPTKNFNPDDGDKAVDLTCSANFYGRQQRDGHGQLWHYRTLEAIRTYNGLIINNRQCWSRGFAHCSTPRHTDYSLPIGAIRDMIRGHDSTIYDINRIEGDRETGRIVHFDTDEKLAVFIGRDSTARDADAYLLKLEGSEYMTDPADVEREILRPEAVKNSDMLVIGADEYTKTRFNDPSEETIQAEGLKKVTSNWGRDHWKNHKMYRAELQGSSIVRQGEWFFIPRPDYEKLDHHNAGPSALEELGNHEVVRDDGAAVDSDGRLYVRGTIGHRWGGWSDGDHNAINLGDVWHQAVTHDRDCVTVEFGASGAGRAD